MDNLNMFIDQVVLCDCLWYVSSRQAVTVMSHTIKSKTRASQFYKSWSMLESKTSTCEDTFVCVVFFFYQH